MRRLLAVALCSISALAHAEDRKAGNVQISTSDGKGTITIDGVSRGEGAFNGEIAPGTHTLVVEREGFERVSKSFTVTASAAYVETVTLVHTAGIAKVDAGAETFGGFYGAFAILGTFSIAGTGSTWESQCALIGATSCDSPAPLGMGLGGYFGYTWDPVGLEIRASATVDSSTPTAHFDGVVKPGSNPVLTGPARTESFRVLRAGGMFALRARATLDGKVVRASAAAGFGFAFRSLWMDRDTKAADGGADTFAPGAVDYFAPAVSLEIGAQFRFSKNAAFIVALELWIENATNSAVTKSDPDRYLAGGTGGIVPLRTPDYAVVSGAQVLLLPTLGLQFGP